MSRAEAPISTDGFFSRVPPMARSLLKEFQKAHP